MLTKALLFMAGHAAAHMIMKSPPPFGNPDNGPLSAASFPCKLTGDPATFYSGVEATEMEIGTDQTLSFSGSAVHGGGSCQLAITSDKAPTASSQWQVILSIMSGCPSVDGSGPSDYKFQIPDSVAPGEYTFAWTWISKLAGQPEYYMNCSPIKVKGGAAAKRDVVAVEERDGDHEMMTLATREATLPGLFVGNLGDLNDCKTVPGTDPVYPNPGANVQKPGTSPNFADVAGNCIAPGTQENSPTGGGGGGGGDPPKEDPPKEDPPKEDPPPPPPAETTPPPPPPATTTAPPVENQAPPATTEAPPADKSPLPAASFPSGFITTTSKAAAGEGGGDGNDGFFVTTSKGAGGGGKDPVTTPPTPPKTTPASAPPKTSPTKAPETKPAPPPTTGGGGGGGSGLTGACTEEGTFNCVGGSQYQQCAAGAWTALQAMAAGTACAEGKSTTLWARDLRGGRLHRRMRIEA